MGTDRTGTPWREPGIKAQGLRDQNQTVLLRVQLKRDWTYPGRLHWPFRPTSSRRRPRRPAWILAGFPWIGHLWLARDPEPKRMEIRPRAIPAVISLRLTANSFGPTEEAGTMKEVKRSGRADHHLPVPYDRAGQILQISVIVGWLNVLLARYWHSGTNRRPGDFRRNVLRRRLSGSRLGGGKDNLFGL